MNFDNETHIRMAQVALDLHEALDVKWGHDPYAEIKRLKEVDAYAEKSLRLLATVEREWPEVSGENSGLLWQIRDLLAKAATGAPANRARDSANGDESVTCVTETVATGALATVCGTAIAMEAAKRGHEIGVDPALKEMEERKDAAYEERNRVVAALAWMALWAGWKAGTRRTAIEGWSDDWHGCVYIDFPNGQASWHYHDSHAHLFRELPVYHAPWDGHTTPEKGGHE